MAWFLLGDQKSQRLRVGIHLRVRHLPKDLMDKVTALLPKDSTLPPEHQIEFVKIDAVLPKNRCRLEFWTSTHTDRCEMRGEAFRYTVVTLVVPQDDQWVCESDAGRGLVMRKTKVGKEGSTT